MSIFLWVGFWNFGCISQEIPFREYDISVRVSDSQEGATYHATLLYEWFGEGDLRYPMYPIDEIAFDIPGSVPNN